MMRSMRSYQTEDDYHRIREFLRRVFLLNGRRTFCWPVSRFDYWRWHGIKNLAHGSLEKSVYLWETQEGQIAAVLNSEEPGHAFLQVHPEYKSAELEERMIVQAEEHLRVKSRRGGSVLWLWTEAGDDARIEILRDRSFVHYEAWDEHQWRRDLRLPIHEGHVPEGYVVRSLGGEAELPSRSWASWRAFHSSEPDENYAGDWRWYLNIQAAPLYRPDLDLVAIAPSGEVAAFTTIWYDGLTCCGDFEPVGTVPDHQRKGLARALLCEGMRRLKQSGATQCMVGGGSPPANGLYQAVFGTVYDVYQPWERRWPE